MEAGTRSRKLFLRGLATCPREGKAHLTGPRPAHPVQSVTRVARLRQRRSKVSQRARTGARIVRASAQRRMNYRQRRRAPRPRRKKSKSGRRTISRIDLCVQESASVTESSLHMRRSSDLPLVTVVVVIEKQHTGIRQRDERNTDGVLP